jgi:hypothetical protein
MSGYRFAFARATSLLLVLDGGAGATSAAFGLGIAG